MRPLEIYFIVRSVRHVRVLPRPPSRVNQYHPCHSWLRCAHLWLGWYWLPLEIDFSKAIGLANAMLSIFDSNKQKTPLEISVVFDRWGRCTVAKSTPIVKRSWNQEKYTLPWPWIFQSSKTKLAGLSFLWVSNMRIYI
jgi:hypothetical protein